MSDENTKPQEEKVEETTAPEATTEETSTEATPETPAADAAKEAHATEEEAPAESAEADAPAEEPKQEEEAQPATPSPAEAYKAKLEGFDRLKAGQTVRLHERIQDVSPKGEARERIQVFEGMVMALGGSGIARTITLRKTSNGVGVEKIYPINSPVVSKIELIKSAKVRQAKLGYLKNPKRRFKRKLKEVYTALGMQKKKKKRR